MKLSKKFISLLLAVLLIGAAFVMPLSVNALNSSAEINIMDKVSGWEAGLYKDTDGTKQNNSKWFRSKDFIDVHIQIKSQSDIIELNLIYGEIFIIMIRINNL